jgi:aryl-alcohol dehydrogenase-like predicted oxidoreductase
VQWRRSNLGKTAIGVPELGLGGAGIGGPDVTDRDAVETLDLALSAGIDFLDTSPLYGESERRLGIALRGIPRSSFRLSTKVGTHPDRRGDYSRDATLWSVENSLRLLGTDHFDIVFVHDPSAMEPVLATDGALETLEKLQEEGVVRSIGLGQRRHDFHLLAIETNRFDVILTFNDYHPLRTTALESGLLDFARAAGVGVVNGSPLSLGMLVADPGDPETARRYSWQPREWTLLPSFQTLCRSFDIRPEAAALQFSLRQLHIDCTLTGARNPEELRRNIDACRHPIPDPYWEALASARFTEGQT